MAEDRTKLEQANAVGPVTEVAGQGLEQAGQKNRTQQSLVGAQRIADGDRARAIDARTLQGFG